MREAMIVATIVPQLIPKFIPLRIKTNLLEVLVGVSIPAVEVGVEVCTEAMLGESSLDGFPLPELTTWTFRMSIWFNVGAWFAKRIF